MKEVDVMIKNISNDWYSISTYPPFIRDEYIMVEWYFTLKSLVRPSDIENEWRIFLKMRFEIFPIDEW